MVRRTSLIFVLLALALASGLAGSAHGEPGTGVFPWPISVPDPDGGLPWSGLTVGAPGAGYCTMLGRVRDGVLGVVGDDDTFYGLPQRASCVGPSPEGPAGHFGGTIWPSDDRTRRRTLFYGELGPHLVSVQFIDRHGRITSAPVGPDGQYLAVYRGYLSPAQTPRIVATFAGGCGRDLQRLLSMPDARRVGCRVVARLDAVVPRPRTRPHESRASKQARRNPSAPVPVHVRPATARPQSPIDVRFRAPITLRRGERYEARVVGPGGPGCRRRDAQAARDVIGGLDAVRGGVVSGTLFPPGSGGDARGAWCPGRYRVAVSFVRTSADRRRAYTPFGHAVFESFA
jgi:hypothetical protein